MDTMGVLDGIKVLDMATVWAGPLASAYLADQGAEVVKVEPKEGEMLRRIQVHRPVVSGEARSFLVADRGKRSIAVNITVPQGQEIVYRLVKTADVLIHNFRPDVPERLGYDYPTLSHLNSRLIYVEVAAYGYRGPYARRRGYEPLFQSLAGVMDRQRLPDGTPIGAGVWLSDMATPFAIDTGVALALYHREKTGLGQKVETSLLHMELAMQTVDLVGVEHEEPLTGGPDDWRADPVWAPYQSSDGKWVIICAITNKEFRDLCNALEMPTLPEEPQFATPRARGQNREDLYTLVSGVVSTRPREEWLKAFEKHDVPAAPVVDQEEVIDQPQVRENNMVIETEHPVAGRVSTIANPVRLSAAAPDPQPRPAPLLGEHTDEVLGELGYSADEVDSLRGEGVVL
ncbi:MAG: CoA transferase [Chloroflexi bacterium]|nr:CoA transferase [Chloroflexota bacterium]